MTDFDLLLTHAQQPVEKFARSRDIDPHKHPYTVPGQNVAFWVHPFCMDDAECYREYRNKVQVWLRVPSDTWWGKLWKKRVWREIWIKDAEQMALFPHIVRVKQHLDAKQDEAASKWRARVIKSALAMPDGDFNAVKDKANDS